METIQSFVDIGSVRLAVFGMAVLPLVGRRILDGRNPIGQAAKWDVRHFSGAAAGSRLSGRNVGRNLFDRACGSTQWRCTVTGQ
jgi:hypothetical protein